jgi:hypothetical protein
MNERDKTLSPVSSLMSSYTPVPYEFKELLNQRIDDQQNGRIFFFNERNVFDSVDGRVMRMDEFKGSGLFVILEPSAMIRADRIITLFGKPGPAYDEYDRYGNVCMECTGGYDV